MTPMPPKRETFEIDAARLSYVESERVGPAIVFQHGLCGAAGQTTEAFPPGTGWRMLTLECRGHGESELGDPDAISINTFASDVLGLMDHQGIDQAVLGGISMGAAISLQLAVQRPDRVRALILARPAWVCERSPDNMRPNLEVGQLMEQRPSSDAKQQFLASCTARYLREASPDNLATLTGFFDRKPQATTSALLRRISVDGPAVSPADLAKLQLPCLVIGHQDDVIHPLALAKELADLIPNAHFVEITPKSVSRNQYLQDMHQAIQQFLKGIPHA